ncbi:hypothetical protein [Campylobacter taeniopygiae]|uniref:Uncharacterized protein n=1 Tax=Campylobacter taeniopygiae TaxID=2510188 RepID=A0ABY2TH62_9BACT|nr:hypothetical protein [Campylobacter taeniopygiae]TKX33452.1 hypothetical protein CQA75_07490 [Campylobacter taeniopygiae]
MENLYYAILDFNILALVALVALVGIFIFLLMALLNHFLIKNKNIEIRKKMAIIIPTFTALLIFIVIIVCCLKAEEPNSAYLDNLKIPNNSLARTFMTNLGFGICYRDNYTGETCLNYLKYFENKNKEEQEEKAKKEEAINENIKELYHSSKK